MRRRGVNDLPYTVNDPSVELELLYIDDLVDEMIPALLGKEHPIASLTGWRRSCVRMDATVLRR